MRYIILLICVGCTINLLAQNKKLTIEDCVLKGKTSLAPEKLSQPIWVENKSILFYTRKINGADKLVKYDWKKKPTTIVWSLSKLNEAFRRKKLDTLKKIPVILKATSEYFQFINVNSLIRYDYKKDSIILDFFIDESAENIDVSKISNNIAYVSKNNLFIKPFNGKLQTITTDGGYEVVYGKSVHRDEYGISKGTFWSPKGDMLAFYKMDQSMVADYPIIDLENKPAKEHKIKYPMAGEKSHEVSIGVYNTINQKLVYLNILGPADQYLTNIAWSNDQKHIYVVVINRKTNHLWLNEYDAASGSYNKTILEEENNIWVEPTNPVQFLPNSNSTFVWQSQRTGHNHLYLYDVNGELIKTLTHGDWDVISVAGTTSIKNKLFFTATTTSPLDQQICSIDLNGFSNYQQISHESGIHTILLNEQSGDYLDMFGSHSIPRISSIYDKKGKLRSNILLADNPLKDYKLGATKIISLKAEDNTILFARMILPPNFDSTKKYPSITYVYNGPHVQLINNSWLNGADLWLYYLAQEGFVVFTVDGRGSGNRGFDFEKIIHRQLGTAEIADQIKGNNYLRGLKFIDTARLGIHGWSYGGFMTTSLMTRTPGKYKVGVCGGPVIDWSFYEVMYTERYMDTPNENPEGFKKNNLLNYVDNLSGKLLIIHGTSDDVVVWQHSLLY
ncbi:MAG: hypothetical protein RIQ33_1677, partial [Bacteroidota bacterium]